MNNHAMDRRKFLIEKRALNPNLISDLQTVYKYFTNSVGFEISFLLLLTISQDRKKFIVQKTEISL